MDRITAQSIYGIQVNDGPWEYAKNTVALSGMDHWLDVGFRNQSQTTTWYLAPFATNSTPTVNWTPADFDDLEFTNYVEATRQPLVCVAAQNGVISNEGNLASITIGSGAQDTIWGIGLLSTSGKASSTGVLFSAARLGAQRTNLQEGDVINLSWRLQLANP